MEALKEVFRDTQFKYIRRHLFWSVKDITPLPTSLFFIPSLRHYLQQGIKGSFVDKKREVTE
jgi:hypothetical protein